MKDELAFLERYLEIEKMRFPDRLNVHFRIALETLAAQVPNLVLQPIVENAIRHGIAPNSAAGRIDIRAFREKGRLQMEVQDDGYGVSESQKRTSGQGVGLKNVRNRLTQLYGEAQTFELQNLSPKGLLVKIVIPFEQNEAPE